MDQNNQKRNRTFQIAFGGICLVLTLLCMFGGAFIPGVDLTLFAAASFFTAVMIIETGVGGGALLFAGASVLGLIIIPNKAALIPYIFLFGYYGILKLFIEKIRSPVLQVLLKCVFFAAALCVGLLGFRELLAAGIDLPDYAPWILIPAGVIFLLLYDYIFTLAVRWYSRRMKKAGSDDLTLS